MKNLSKKVIAQSLHSQRGFSEKTVFILIIVVAIAASLALWLSQNQSMMGRSVLRPIQNGSAANQLDSAALRAKFPNMLVYPSPKAIVDFTLVRPDGKPVRKELFLGHYSIVTFGFTTCPDVCPTTLTELKALLAGMPAQQQKPEVLFVSIDPERDLQNDLSGYVGHYGAAFKAISGEIPALTAFAANLGAVFEKQSLGDSGPDYSGQKAGDGEKRDANAAADYTMVHTASLFIVGPNAELLAVARPKPNHNTGVSEFDWQALRSELPAVLQVLQNAYP